MALATALFCPATGQQQRVKIRARDFEAPAQTGEGKRSLIKGSDARPVGNEIYEITSAQVTVYNPDDTVDMLVESPLCQVNMDRKSPEAQVASSSTNLFVRTGDEKFAIEGVGWRWDPNLSTLSISNQVVARIRKTAISSANTNATADLAAKEESGGNTHIRVTSQRFEHKGEMAVFAGKVLVEDGLDTLNCEILKVHFREKAGVQLIEAEEKVHLVQGETEATGGKAVYNVREDTFRLLDKPAWRAGDREGRSELLVIHRTNNTFKAEGNVYMKLPYTNSVTGSRGTPQGRVGKTNSFVEVYADYFDYFGGPRTAAVATAYYRGDVKVLHGEGEILCRFLTVLFSPKQNKLVNVVAEDDVRIQSGKNTAFGQKAVYDLVEEKITLTGQPHWVMEDKSGSSEVVVFFPETEELLALQKVRMRLPSGSVGEMDLLGGASQKSRPQGRDTNAFMTITADIFSRKDDVSVFRDNVQVEDQQGRLRSEMLTVLTSGTNQVQRIVARHNVVLEQEEMIATGQEAVYSLATGLMELTGNPRIKQEDRTVTAEQFIINRPENTFTMRGRKWKIETVAKKKEGERSSSQ